MKSNWGVGEFRESIHRLGFLHQTGIYPTFFYLIFIPSSFFPLPASSPNTTNKHTHVLLPVHLVLCFQFNLFCHDVVFLLLCHSDREDVHLYNMGPNKLADIGWYFGGLVIHLRKTKHLWGFRVVGVSVRLIQGDSRIYGFSQNVMMLMLENQTKLECVNIISMVLVVNAPMCQQGGLWCHSC